MIAPLIGGLLISFLGFPVIFIIAIITIFLSALPFAREQTSTGLTHQRLNIIMTELTDVKHSKQHLIFFSMGAIFLIAEVVWPIAVYTFFNDFAELGLFATIATLIATIITYLLTKMFTRYSKEYLLTMGTVQYAFGWLLRGFVSNRFIFIIADFAAKIGDNFTMIPLYAITYDWHALEDKTSFQLRRIMTMSLGYALPACIAIFWPAEMIRILLFTAPLFCLSFLAAKK